MRLAKTAIVTVAHEVIYRSLTDVTIPPETRAEIAKWVIEREVR